MENYIFTKCLNPRGIFNPYICEWVSVPCGHCKACLLDKSYRYKQLTTLESLGYRCTYFVTLTYSNEYLPKCYPIYNDDDDTYSLIDIDSGEVFATVSCSSITDDLIEKFHSDYIPYLNKVDIQLFIKRLRKYYGKNKLRYFAVGEYGPKHFRPHYHLLLWFESPTSCKELEEVVSEKWSFGRIDVQKARGDAAKYVTGYANSFSFVPNLFKAFNKAKPFCLHSTKLGEKNIPYSSEDLLFNEYSSIDTLCVPHDGRNDELTLWRSYILRHVPRCSGLSYKNSYICYTSYTIFNFAKSEFSYESIYDLAEQIYNYVNMANHNPYKREQRKVIYDFFSRYFPNPNTYLHYTRKDMVESIINRIYRDLLCSYKFCKLAEDIDFDDGSSVYSSFSSRYSALYHYVVRFYKDRDLRILNNYYSKLEKFTKDYETYIKDYNLFDIIYNQRYENKVIDTPVFNLYNSQVDDNFNKSIKHKIQNDLNNLLSY